MKHNTFHMFLSSLGVIRYFESRSNLLHPTFFIFAEKDDYVPLEEVSFPSEVFEGFYSFHACFVIWHLVKIN